MLSIIWTSCSSGVCHLNYVSTDVCHLNYVCDVGLNYVCDVWYLNNLNVVRFVNFNYGCDLNYVVHELELLAYVS